MKNNCLLTTKTHNKNGKVYHNFICKVKLENGKEAKFSVKLSFFNKKFLKLLLCNLPKEVADNENE